MQRYNIFNQIHKGLRTMLYDTAMSLQHTVFMNTDEANQTLSKVEEAIHLFHSHAEHEDMFVLPAVEKHAASLVNEFASEHETDEQLSVSLRSLIASYNLASDSEARTAAGYAITMAFNEFIAFNLYHMNKEEDKINKVLWKHYTDGELVAITQAIIASIPPEDMAIETDWMIKGLNNYEIINWLSAVKNDAPDFVFKSLLSQAEAVLPEQRWNEIKEGLMEGAMMA